MYKSLHRCEKIDKQATVRFSVEHDVRQGDSLALLFAVFINDIPHDIKSLNLGINNDEQLSI